MYVQSELKRFSHGFFFFTFFLFTLQQVDERYIKNIHLHSSGSIGSSGTSGKNSHRSKTSTNSQSRDKHESSGNIHTRSYASALSQSPVPSSMDRSWGK